MELLAPEIIALFKTVNNHPQTYPKEFALHLYQYALGLAS